MALSKYCSMTMTPMRAAGTRIGAIGTGLGIRMRTGRVTGGGAGAGHPGRLHAGTEKIAAAECYESLL